MSDPKSPEVHSGPYITVYEDTDCKEDILTKGKVENITFSKEEIENISEICNSGKKNYNPIPFCVTIAFIFFLFSAFSIHFNSIHLNSKITRLEKEYVLLIGLAREDQKLVTNQSWEKVLIDRELGEWVYADGNREFKWNESTTKDFDSALNNLSESLNDLEDKVEDIGVVRSDPIFTNPFRTVQPDSINLIVIDGE